MPVAFHQVVPDLRLFPRPARQEDAMRFDGRRVLVAGSAGGIGAASAAAFRDDGAAVARGTRDADGLARFAAAHGGTDIH
ncbi:MAG: hypothetical protein ACLFPZ_10330, partial [Rhodosalinus sp.]